MVGREQDRVMLPTDRDTQGLADNLSRSAADCVRVYLLSLPAQNVSLSRADKLRREKENGKATEEVVHA